MSCDIEAVSPDGPLHRLGRLPDAWTWPDWAYADLDEGGLPAGATRH